MTLFLIWMTIWLLGISISLNKVKESLFLDLHSLDALERSMNSFHSKRVVQVPLGCSKELLESFHHERSLAFVQKPFFCHSKKELLKTPSREELQRKRLFLPFGRNLLFWIPDSVRFWYVPQSHSVKNSSSPKNRTKTSPRLFNVFAEQKNSNEATRSFVFF